MISSLMTFRLNLRSADSIDSFAFTVTDAIYFLTSFSAKDLQALRPEHAPDAPRANEY